MKILVGYDGSRAAWDALATGQTFARAFGAKLHIATSMIGGAEEDRATVERAEKKLAELKALVDKEGIDCQTHLLIRGRPPGEDLVAFAKERGITHMVIGVRRRSNLGKIIFGSTARFVILNAACPVTTVK
jgi:nucleotide-binding universal stress UspA family protein